MHQVHSFLKTLRKIKRKLWFFGEKKDKNKLIKLWGIIQDPDPLSLKRAKTVASKKRLHSRELNLFLKPTISKYLKKIIPHLSRVVSHPPNKTYWDRMPPYRNSKLIFQKKLAKKIHSLIKIVKLSSIYPGNSWTSQGTMVSEVVQVAIAVNLRYLTRCGQCHLVNRLMIIWNRDHFTWSKARLKSTWSSQRDRKPWPAEKMKKQ